MRRDVIHYYEKGIAEVFEAYRAAAMRKFGKDCNAEPYHTLSFGLNYSLKYNMNGGACTVHFMPYKTGTAVDVRYSIVQLAGARYGAHDREMSTFVSSVIGAPALDLQIDPETFLLDRNKVSSAAYTASPAAPVNQPRPAPQPTQTYQPAPQPVNVQPTQTYQPAPQPVNVQPAQVYQPAPQPVRTNNFCGKCGGRLQPGARFCGKCGNRII